MMYILLFLIFILVVVVERIIKHQRNKKLGWKATKKSYKEILYSEKIEGTWKGIKIDAEINFGTFEPVFKTKLEWRDYPNWAHDRTKIIKRVKKRFPLKNDISEIGEKEV